MTEPTEYVEVVITADSADWLADFTRRLVEDHFAACGHNIAPIRSIYRWEGAVHDEAEARVALHTRAALVLAIMDRRNAEHLYEVPCVIALTITAGNPHILSGSRTRQGQTADFDYRYGSGPKASGTPCLLTSTYGSDTSPRRHSCKFAGGERHLNSEGSIVRHEGS